MNQPETSPINPPINASFPSLNRFSMIGVNIKSTPIDILEKVALSHQEIDNFYQLLSISDDTQSEHLFKDSFIVSTCNRTEIYCLTQKEKNCAATLATTLEKVVGTHRFPPKSHWYEKFGTESVQHLFRVACGLDSMIVGEAQITGQMKSALARRQSDTQMSPAFDAITRHAFKAAKESRVRTDIGAGAVSIASAAVQLCQRIYSDLSKQHILVIGAGETGRLVAEHFTQKGAGKITIANRSPERGQQLALQVQGDFIPLEKLSDGLKKANIIVSTIKTDAPIINRTLLESCRQNVEKRPLAIIDLGLPRNIAQDVNLRSNTFVHDISALGRVVDHNLALRKKEIPLVEEIIQKEIKKLKDWQNQLNAAPFILTLKDAIEKIRQEEIEKYNAHLDKEGQETLNEATRAIVNKIMHGPMVSIKSYAKQAENGLERLEIVRDLFSHLDHDPSAQSGVQTHTKEKSELEGES